MEEQKTTKKTRIVADADESPNEKCIPAKASSPGSPEASQSGTSWHNYVAPAACLFVGFFVVVIAAMQKGSVVDSGAFNNTVSGISNTFIHQGAPQQLAWGYETRARDALARGQYDRAVKICSEGIT